MRCSSALTRLALSDNDLGDSGLSAVAAAAEGANALADLDLSRNAGTGARRGWMGRSGNTLGSLIAVSTTLTALNLQWNTLAGPAALEIARALLRNTTLTSLNLGWNGFGKCGAVDVIGRALVSGIGARVADCSAAARHGGCGLRELDLSFNAISDRQALQLAECLARNSRLLRLRLDGNPLMMSGVAALRRARAVIGNDFDEPFVISMEACGADTQAANAFDVMHPAGTYVLDLSLEYDRVVVRRLVQIALAGDGEFDVAGMTLNQRPFRLALAEMHAGTAAAGISSERSGGGDRAKRVLSRVVETMQFKRNGRGRSERSVLVPGTNLPLFGVLRFNFGETQKPPVRLCGCSGLHVSVRMQVMKRTRKPRRCVGSSTLPDYSSGLRSRTFSVLKLTSHFSTSVEL